jgi:hypothetical protein
MIRQNILVILKRSRNPMIPIRSRRNMKSCSPDLWDNFEALFAEVAIESKCSFNFMPTHGVKT